MAPVLAVLASGFLLQAALFRVIMLVLPTWQHGFDSLEYQADFYRIHAVFASIAWLSLWDEPCGRLAIACRFLLVPVC